MFRKLIGSGRIVDTFEKQNGFHVANHDGSIVNARLFDLNDVRFSPPFEESVNQNKTILELIEEERQKAYLQGLKNGLIAAISIKNRHFANHKLLKQHPPEELWQFDEFDIERAWGLPQDEQSV